MSTRLRAGPTDNNVVSEADPGFKPLPEDADWIAKVEYAKAHQLPHPYHWPKERHAEWSMGMLEPAVQKPL